VIDKNWAAVSADTKGSGVMRFVSPSRASSGHSVFGPRERARKSASPALLLALNRLVVKQADQAIVAYARRLLCGIWRMWQEFLAKTSLTATNWSSGREGVILPWNHDGQ
jgi:hypothetical protein